MGKFSDKVFDNSGKNTQNEIYDTSHRQYWNPPGQVAWKDNLIGFFGIVLSVLLVMLIDCFLLHPIPAPEGTFDLYGNTTPSFGLAASGCEYADAKILSSNTASHGSEMYLIEQDGQIHLIRFHESVLFTRKIADDVILANAQPQTVTLSGFLRSAEVEIDSDGRINVVSGFDVFNSNRAVFTAYIVLGVAIALLGSVCWGKVKGSRT